MSELAKTSQAWRVEEGANSHVFDGRLLNSFGECVGFVLHLVSPATAHILQSVNGPASELREALRRIIAADDDFRASMSPETEKDPVTLACEEAKAVLARASL